MNKLGKLFTYLFTGQFGKIAHAVRRRIPGWVFRRGRAFIFELSRDAAEPLLKPVTFPDGYQGRFAQIADMPACAEAAEAVPDAYEKRLDAGELCFAVFNGEKAANLNWIHAGPYYVRGMGYLHPEKDAKRYIYGILTVPSERGKGLYRAGLLAIANELFRIGDGPLVQMVEADNAPVLHTLPKIGYVETRIIKHICILGVKYTTVFNIPENRLTRRLFIKPPRSAYVI